MAIVDIEISSNVSVSVLDSVARAAIGAGCTGCSNRKGVAVIHVEDEGQNVAKATAILSNWNTLLIAATKSTIDADGVDSTTITHDTPDAALDYYVWLDGAAYAEGEVTAVAGVVTLALSTSTAGQYTVMLARKAGNYASGMTIIEAIDV